MKLYQILASKIDARLNCEKSGNTEWFERHETDIKRLFDELPHGSGIDSDYRIDFEKSHGEKIVFHFSFHHMDENGMYDGWTDHTLTVRPSLMHGFTISISGPTRNNIKEYLYEAFAYDLNKEIEE